jgi:hypothetical protein
MIKHLNPLVLMYRPITINASRIIAPVAQTIKIRRERSLSRVFGTRKALQIDGGYPQKPKLLAKHSQQLQEACHA